MKYLILIFLVFFTATLLAEDKVWLLVDTDKKIIQVMRGYQLIESYEKISLGRNGAGHKQQSGDDITPIGRYKITSINDKSHFKIFLGINYPSVYDAGSAMYSERISMAEYLQIMQAHREGKMPPQTTKLGGYLGIHGVGSGNIKIQGLFDWTHGCIAVSNRQIEQLRKWVYLGMRVEIK